MSGRFTARNPDYRAPTIFSTASVASIRQLVQQALATGYLTAAAEAQLRQLLQTTKYGREDINAFISLQEAAMSGHVKQESRELKHLNTLTNKDSN